MKSVAIRKVLSLLISFILIFQQVGFAQGIAQLDIAKYFGALSGPQQFRPLQMRYFSYNPLTDNFQMLLDKGSLKKVADSQLKEQGQELLKYFLIGVALPDDNFWVNLRPDSADQIISRDLAGTDLGKVLLEADLQLKKDVAKFTSPETAEGREYWNKLYQKAGQIFNASEITIPTLTRPWIVPGEVIIRESENSAYVYKGTLKVMLEQDHLKNSADYNFTDPRLKELNEYSSQIIREKIIPKLTQEINSSSRYAALRQVFYSLILSRWFKHKFAGKTGQYASLINSGNLNGLTSQQAWSKKTYFNEYKKSFAQGEYNLKEQINSVTGPVIRSYFSGGITMQGFKVPGQNVTSLTGIFTGSSPIVTAALLGNGIMVPLAGAVSPAGAVVPNLKLITNTGVPEVMSSSPIDRQEAVTAPVSEPGKRIYFFGADQTEGRGDMKVLLGGKGAELAQMAQLGLPVPPGFTITTQVAMEYLHSDSSLFPEGLQEEINRYLARLEEVRGKKLGDPDDPLLVSVRSGARVSMPGMMDTVLNLGLNDKSVEGLARKTDNPRFAYNSYARFIEMFADVVLGIERKKFSELANQRKIQNGFTSDTQLTVDDYKYLVGEFKQIVKEETKKDFPQDPKTQLRLAIEAVFKSSNNQRAIRYREEHKLPNDTVSAVNVQSMVFGNMDERSATGVVLTRHPDGRQGLYGEFLVNAQGEDVVAGIRTPLKIDELKNLMPEVYQQLNEIGTVLDRHNRDLQDMEFTIEQGKLYMLQTRSAKRDAAVMLRVAVQMVQEGMITKEEALSRIDIDRVERELMHPLIDPKAAKQATKLATGTAGSPGAGVGRVVFISEDAEEWAKRGEPIILTREETSPEDLGGMLATKKNGGGILTSQGGATSHAALVARGEGIPAVVGVGELNINDKIKKVKIAGTNTEISEGDWLTIDGSTGNVYLGRITMIASEIEQVQNGTMRPEESRIYQDFAILLSWADQVRTLGVWANSDTPDDVRKAVNFGAEGVGLTRTEHMFRDKKAPDGTVIEPRLLSVQTMFIAKEGSPERNMILRIIGDMQRRDFEGILDALDGRPATIRFLDPPVNEFVPKLSDKTAIRDIARRLKELSTNTPGWWLRFDRVLKSVGLSLIRKADREGIKGRLEQMDETDPMMGSRGVRLLLTNPSILRMQTRAMVQAYANLVKQGKTPKLKMMIPNVSKLRELQLAKAIIAEETKAILDTEGIPEASRTRIEIGTMIEQPSAALSSGSFAKEAKFFSYGTNDLTQFTFGFSRNDAAKSFLQFYLEHGIFDFDPTKRLDANEVIRLINISVQEGRAENPNLEIGICGEHGGDPSSIELLHKAGLTYVSASTPRIPIARLAAAQAELKYPRRAASVTASKESASSPVIATYEQLEDALSEPVKQVHKHASDTTRMVEVHLNGKLYKYSTITYVPRMLLNLIVADIRRSFNVLFRYSSYQYEISYQGRSLYVNFVSPSVIALEEAASSPVGAQNPDAAKRIEELKRKIAAGERRIQELQTDPSIANKGLIADPSTVLNSPIDTSVELRVRHPDSTDIEAKIEAAEYGLLFDPAKKPLPSDKSAELDRRLREVAKMQDELRRLQSLASSPAQAKSPETPGGIDFRVINMITQPMGNFSGLNFSLPHLSNLENINLNTELAQIQRMLEAGIIPSGERLKEYVAGCYQKGKLKEHLDGIVGCVVGMCRLEEEKAIETTKELKEVLLIIDSV